MSIPGETGFRASRTPWLLLAAMAASLSAAPAIAAAPAANQEFGYVLRAGGAYSDNFTRHSHPDEEASGAAVLALQLAGSRKTGRLRYDLGAEYSRYRYFTGDLKNAGFGAGLLRGSYEFIPDLFRWNAETSFEQARSDMTRPLAPGNVDNVVRYSTGPTLQANLFGAVEMVADGQYSKVAYSNTPYDNETVGGKLRLQRRISPRSQYGAGGSYEDVSYSGFEAFNFVRKEAFAFVRLQGVRTMIEAEGGITRADNDLLQVRAPLYRARLTRQLTPRVSAFAAYRKEIPTSAGANLATDTIVTGGTRPDATVLTAAPRNSEGGEVGFDFKGQRSEASIAVGRTREKSMVLALTNRTYDDLRFRVQRKFSPVSRGEFYGMVARDDFSLQNKFKESTFGGQYSFDFSPALGVDVRLERHERFGRNAENKYVEFAGGVFLRFVGGIGRTANGR